MTRSQRATEWLIKTILAAAIIAGLLYLAQTSLASKKHCENVQCYRAALRWQKHENTHLRRALAQHQTRDARYAIRLSSATFGIQESQMLRIAQCESGLGTQTTAEAGSGAAGVFQFLPSTWRRTPFAGFNVFDPIANSLAAAWLHNHDGSWREWSCSSITGVR